MIFLVIFLMIALIIVGMPVAFALLISSLVYLLAEGVNLSMLAQSLVRGVDSFTLLAVPFFLLVGELMNSGGITNRIIDMARVLVGHFKGGLAQVNNVASLLFSGISGSATADTVALGSVLIPAMEKEGYDKKFAAAITAASSIVGPIIPPSVTLILFGVVTAQPIGPLLIAGLIPGVLITASLMVYTYFISKKRDYPSYPRATFRQARKTFSSGIPALLLPVIIVVGTVSGVFTPTESAAIAALYGIIVTFFYYKNVNVRSFASILMKTSYESAKILFIIAAATIFAWVVTKSRVSDILGDFLFSFTTNQTVIMTIIVIFLFIIGLFMLPSEAIVVFAPILTPIVMDAGIDPIHFGVLMVLTLTIGGATPPVGMMLYIVADIAKLSFTKLVREMLPLYVPLIVTVLLTAYIPYLSLVFVKMFF
ncbi:sialic acid TRAP transporter large permease protein SiaM [Compostibacillus humi]|uniref:Sialic acid TRAP transporter large permease protein SiaM n=1 Tax=Compostibacillus humi TaxID=1245525 RepID=A0A8J2XF70_9BACI|nr:TRAP transporter large permease [Compostibacillus humi]GFZ81674.1 sialic acid TRAP transporter large permease protein SiaM [Compostibacillus humi]